MRSRLGALTRVILGTLSVAGALATAGCSASTAEDATASAPVVADACVPLAEGSEPVQVANEHGPMSGTLEIPARCTGMPVVLLISGSGPQDRDGNAPKIYAHLARGLKAAGIASLRFDDAGVAGSAAAIPPTPAGIAELTYAFEIDAARRWLTLLRGDARFGAVIAAGHSQGALTATLLAQDGEPSGADAVVSLAGAGRPIDVVLREQLAAQLPPALMVKVDAALEKMRAGEPPGPLDPPLDRVLPVAAQRYMISWFAYDPAAELAKVTRPALVVQGGTDVQVKLEDADLLAASKPDAKRVTIDDMCHVLRQAPLATIASQQPQYNDPSLPLHDALLPALTAFVGDVAASRR